MVFVVLQENLIKTANLLTRALPGRGLVPAVLNNFFFRVSQGKINITAGNLEATLTKILPGKIEEEGEVLVPAKTLLSVLSSLPAGKVYFKKEKGALVIKSENSESQIKTETGEEYPQNESNEEGKVAVDTAFLKEAGKKVLFSASEDETRAALTGVLFEREAGKIRAVATDGFRLSFLEKKDKSAAGFDKILLPKTTLALLLQILEEDGEEMSVALEDGKKRVGFFSKTTKLSSLLIQEDFPDYRKIVPQEYETKTTVSRQEMEEAVRLGAVFAREVANIVRLKIEKNKLTVLSNSPQTGAVKTAIKAETEGEILETAFNYRFLLEFLKSRNEEEVVFESGGALAPGVFKTKKEEGFFHIIMPVRLQEE